ncbi:MAG: hypothetical protein ACT4P6_02810 [Gemmatimonadaceae bacterium]
MRKSIAIAITLFAVAACGGKPAATTGAAATAPAPTSPVRGSSRDIITRAEIEAAGSAANAYDLVNRLRPHFFRVEGRSSMGTVPQTPLVRLNGSILGDASQMRSIDVTTLEEVRYYSIVEAETRWSGERGRPVIAITTKKLVGKYE